MSDQNTNEKNFSEKPDAGKPKHRFFDITLLITTVICLLPMAYGVANWSQLPDRLPGHMNLAGEVDRYDSKWVTVFMFPLLIAAFNAVCNIVANLKMAESCARPAKMPHLIKWMMPVTGIFVFSTIYLTAMNVEFDMLFVTNLFCGIIFLVFGNYFPKTDIKMLTYKADPEKFYMHRRKLGHCWVAGGLLCVLTSPFNVGIWIMLGVTAVLVAATVYFQIKTEA